MDVADSGMTLGPRPYVSVITSYFAGTWQQAVKRLFASTGGLGAERNKCVDLYVFQPADAPWLQKMGLAGDTTTELLASATDKQLEDMATDVADYMHSQDIGISRVPALATNIPTISSLDDARREQAVRALNAACKLAHSLQHLGLGTKCVEFVAGPRVTTTKHGDIEAGAGAAEQRRGELFRSIEQLLSQAPKIGLALEVEPGVSFLSKGLEDAWEIVKDVNDDDRLGLNLDMGHLQLLSQLAPRSEPFLTLAQDPDIVKRVQHAHISYHRAGHFADLPLTSDHEEIFRPWIDLYVNIARLPGHSRYFTGAVAVELEMVPFARPALPPVTPDLVVSPSVEQVRQWIEASLERHAVPRTRTGEDEALVIVVLVDIVGSTNALLEEGKPTSEARKKLTRLLKTAIPKFQGIISDCRGRFDKFEGDAVMAYWLLAKDSNDQTRVALTALGCAASLANCWREICQQGLMFDMGLARKIAVMGRVSCANFGSEWHAETTVIGAPVVLMGRLSKWPKGDNPAYVLANAALARLAYPNNNERQYHVKEQGADEGPPAFDADDPYDKQIQALLVPENNRQKDKLVYITP